MEKISLEAKPRLEVGKRMTKQVRGRGAVPAILYGHGMTPLALEVDSRRLHQVLHTKAGENVVIHLNVEGVKLKESTCLIKEIQHEPMTDDIDHVDFTVISLNERITVKVQLVVQNAADALGIKEGGVLDVVHHEIEVECLALQIPEKITVDVKAMKIGDALHAKELEMPKEVQCKLPPDEVVVALHPPAKVVEAPAEEAATQPEVIEKGKKVEAEEGTTPAPSAAGTGAQKAPAGGEARPSGRPAEKKPTEKK